MTLKAKLLGATISGLLALGAVGAPAASAEPALFTAEVGGGETAGVHGGQTLAFGNTFTIGGTPFSCEVANVSGSASTAGPSSTIARLAPQYSNCHMIVGGFLTLPITVTVNGCEYTFNATKNTTDTEGNLTPFSADLTIDCPTGKQIEIHVYTSKAKHEADESLCTFDIGPQTVNNHIQLTNEAGAPNDILAHVTNLPIVLNNTKPSSTCCQGSRKFPTFDHGISPPPATPSRSSLTLSR